MGGAEPKAAALIRQQARDIDELWDRLSRAYAVISRETPSDELRSSFAHNWNDSGQARDV
jgi:hypothetical protein